MVQQAALPFKYEASMTAGATAFAGLPLYLELSRVVGLGTLVKQNMLPPSAPVGPKEPSPVGPRVGS